MEAIRLPRVRTTAERVPTGTIRDLWRAEDGRADIVASWFDIDIEDVTMAVAFEDCLS